jgi:hypothetical protein
MKSIFTSLIATSLTLTAFADQAPSSNKSMSKDKDMMMTDPNPMARWGTKDDSNVFLSGEVLFLQVLGAETQSSYTFWSATGVPTQEVDTFKPFKYTFQPGFRVALGYNTNYDGWDTAIIYTGLFYKKTNDFSILTNVVTTNPYPDSLGTVSYTYNYQQVDLDLGRMFKVSKHLKLRPHVGIRGMWLTQKGVITETFSGFKAVSGGGLGRAGSKKITGNLYGLEAGLNTVWMLSKEFSVYADLGFSSLVNSQGTIAKQDSNSTTVGDYFSNDIYKPMARLINGYDLSLGFRWDKNFSDDSYHVGINLGYELHTYTNINNPQIELDNTGFAGIGSPLLEEPDFSLQGVALGLRFDF